MKITLAALALAAILAGCTTTRPDVVQRGDAQRLSTVVDATVLSVRDVTVDGTQSGVGATTGAVVGGIAGSGVSHGRESAAAAVIGAVVGGVIGNVVERTATREDAVEILLQLRSGERRAIVQAKGNEVIASGDEVIIVTTGGKVRVTKAPPTTRN